MEYADETVFTFAWSSDVDFTVIKSESSRTPLECAVRFDCSAKTETGKF